MNDRALSTDTKDPRELALMQAIGFDKLSPAQRELGLEIAKRYDLDPLLKHIVLIEGRAYITRDGLLHIAHRSQHLDGMETTEPAIIDGFWRASCSVYRNDMTRPFTYTGRYPTSGGNQKYAPEMAVKVAEVMALRRAFDVAAPTAEERWDVPEVAEESKSAAAPSLAERAALKAAELAPAVVDVLDVVPVEADVVEVDEASPVAAHDGSPLGRLRFMDALQTTGISPAAATSRAAELFPGVEPKALTDAQRGALLADLTSPVPA